MIKFLTVKAYTLFTQPRAGKGYYTHKLKTNIESGYFFGQRIHCGVQKKVEFT